MPLKILKSLLITLVLSTLLVPLALAQESPNITVTLVEEVLIGTRCPEASALSPDGTSLWVLMHNCGQSRYFLQNFSVDSSGFDFNDDDAQNYADSLSSLDGLYLDGILFTPLGVAEDGTPQLLVFNADEEFQSIRPAEGFSEVNSALTEQIVSVGPYPDYAIFNADQTIAAVLGTDALHIFDVASAAEILAVPIETDVLDYGRIQFTADGQSVDLIVPDDPENMNSFSATLYRYSLPDGELLLEQSLLSSLAWVSPNGQYVLNWMEEDELLVVESATGEVSNSIFMYEEPRPATSCANEDGFDPSELGAVWDGFLPPMGINWLPDSSGFVTVNTYGGDGAQSGGIFCFFSESRLRLYAVGHEG